MAPLKCCVGGCNSTSATIRLFALPKIDSLRNLWMSYLVPTNPNLLLLSKSQLVNKRVCRKHFDQTQFDVNGERLRYSYPCLFTDQEMSLGIPMATATTTPMNEHNYSGHEEPVLSPDTNTSPDLSHTTTTPMNEHNYSGHEEPVLSHDTKTNPDHSHASDINMQENDYSLLQSTSQSSIFQSHYESAPQNLCHKEQVLRHTTATLPDLTNASDVIMQENDYSLLQSTSQASIFQSHYGVLRYETNLPHNTEVPIPKDATTVNSNQTKTSGPLECEKTVTVQSHKRSLRANFTKELTSKEEKLLQKLQKATVTLKKISKSSLDLEKLESPILKKLVEDAASNQNKKPHGKRWNHEIKTWSLALYKRSPKAYRFLQAALPMPSTKTLIRLLKHVPMGPGINGNILNALKNQVEKMSPRDKYCSLLFDEMSLKKRLYYNEGTDIVEGFVDLGTEESRSNKMADHALVFMVQGIARKYKQPIAYYFVEGTISSAQLSVLIGTIIITLRGIGLNVLCTVCDQGPTNIGALNLLKKNQPGQTVDDNFFKVNDEKVFIIYDVPHLIKSIRNNFYQGGEIVYDKIVGKWCYLIEANKRNENFLNFKKISNEVVQPTYKIKMKVKYAAHAMSNTMSAILKMMAWNHEKKNEILNTAKVIEEIDQLFDCCNGPASIDDVKKGIRQNVSLKTNHLEKWVNYLKKIDSMHFLKAGTNNKLKNVRCVQGFKITLKSLYDIWNLLQKKDFRFLNLRQLNQDSLENMFGVIRQHSITNSNPTCTLFTAAIKSVVISGFTPYTRGSNCCPDSNKLLFDFKKIKPVRTENKNVHVLSDETTVPCISIPDYNSDVETDLCNFEQQPTVYVSGYIAHRIMNLNSKCDQCKKYLVIDNPEGNNLYMYTQLREWWSDKNSLTYPTRELCELVNSAKKIFLDSLANQIHKKNLIQWCILQFQCNLNFEWFKCKEHEVSQIFQIIAILFIRKECKIRNENIIIIENKSADAAKKAQMQSIQK